MEVVDLAVALARSCSVVSNSFVTPWTIAHWAPLSMGFCRQEYWSGWPFPSPRDLSDPGIKPKSLAFAGGFFITKLPEEEQPCGDTDCLYLRYRYKIQI